MKIDKETLETCLAIAKGCFDYGGGYRRDEKLLNAYHHGMQTVLNCLEKLRNEESLEKDTQLIAVYKIGESELLEEK